MTTRNNLGPTPGPWRVVDNTDLSDALWIEVDHPEVGNVSLAQVINGCDEADELGSREANARLIAAAPDLLAALKYARRFLNALDHDTAYVDAAIAKASSPALQATGEQS